MKNKINEKERKYKNYDELQKICNSIIKVAGQKPKLTFSMLGEWEDDDGFVLAPDLESKEPVFKGKCVFYDDGGYFNNKYQSNVINNPTWKDILCVANIIAEGDHIFLESVDYKKKVKGVKHYEFFFGS